MIDLSLEDYHSMFFDADEASQDERREGEQARDYYDGKQYTAEELQILNKRKQPPTTLNRVARKINHLKGLEIDRRTDPKAFPRTQEHEKGAEAITEGLRYVEERSNMDEVFTSIHDNMLVEGYGGFELTVTPKKKGGRQEYELGAVYWEWGRLFYDPVSVKPDYSDARYVGGIEWMDIDTAKKRWPSKAAELEGSKTASGVNMTDNYEDEPEKKAWVTKGKRPRIRVIHMYHIVDGTWYLCQFTGGGVLEKKPVPFVDEEGNNWCPMRLQSAYVDRDGDRYGEVRNLISPQDMINKAHSKLQHLTSVRQVIADEGAIPEEYGGIDGARQELAKPDGVIIVNPTNRFEILETADMAAGHATLLQEYKNEIDLMGPNASMLGKGPQSQSGRALIAQTEGGMREFNPVMDRFNSMKEWAYRHVWYLIRQYWTYEKWMNVTDDENKPKYVGLNRPVTRLEKARKLAEQRGFDPDAVEQQVMANPMFAQLAQQVVEVENNVTELDIDVSIEAVGDTATLQVEQFQILSQLAPAMAQAGKPVEAMEILIEASSLRNKEALLEKLRGNDNPQAIQAAQQQQEMQMRGAMAEIAGQEAEAQKTAAEVEQTRAETRKTEIEALRLYNEPLPVAQPA